MLMESILQISLMAAFHRTMVTSFIFILINVVMLGINTAVRSD